MIQASAGRTVSATSGISIIGTVCLGLLALTSAGCGAEGPNQAYAALRAAYIAGDNDGVESALSASFKERIEKAHGSVADYLKSALPPISDLEPLVAKLLPDAKKAKEDNIPELEEKLKQAKEAANSAEGARVASANKRVSAMRRNLEWAKESLDKLDDDFFYRLDAAYQHATKIHDNSFAGLDIGHALALCIPQSEIGKMLENTPQGRHGFLVEIKLPDGTTTVRLTAVEEEGVWKISWPTG